MEPINIEVIDGVLIIWCVPCVPCHKPSSLICMYCWIFDLRAISRRVRLRKYIIPEAMAETAMVASRAVASRRPSPV